MSFADSNEKRFEIHEVDVNESGQDYPEKGFDNEAPVNLGYEDEYEYEETRQRARQQGKGKEKKKNKYGWAFFLCSLFIGLGITATFDAPMGLFAGLGIGFLFFVDPIYDRVMDALNR
jgi:hypothetical protein